jgi:hypothetical protein
MRVNADILQSKAMTALDRVLAKYNWAKQHVDKFEVAVDDFRRNNPYSIRRKNDVERGQVTFYVESVPAIPDALSFMLGDALHNLRSTLDHLASALVVAAGGTPDSHTCFPIFDTSKAYEDLSRSRVKGLGKYCLEELDRVQPYKGAWGHWAWQLHRLDIVDKHRLVLTVASVPVARTMTPSEKAAFDARKTLIGPNTFAAMQMAKAANSPIAAPVEAGHELGTFPLSEANQNMGFAFDIAINEPEIVGLVPTFILLRTYCSETMQVINNLWRFL